MTETENGYEVSVPRITSAAFSVNPCVVGAQTVISVSADEIIKVLQPEDWYSGEIYSDEV